MTYIKRDSVKQLLMLYHCVTDQGLTLIDRVFSEKVLSCEDCMKRIESFCFELKYNYLKQILATLNSNMDVEQKNKIQNEYTIKIETLDEFIKLLESNLLE